MRSVLPYVGAVIVNLALLAFLTQLSKNAEMPDFQFDSVPVTVVETPDLTPPEPPRPPKREPPPEPKETPKFVPSPFAMSVGPLNRTDIVLPRFDGVNLDVDAEGLVFRMEDLDREPRGLDRPVDYPFRAERLGIGGVVVVRFTVLEDGSVRDVEILSAEPEGEFEEAVLQSVPRWKYEPGTVNGRPVKWKRIANIEFKPDR